MTNRLDQFADRVASVQQILRAAVGVVDGGLEGVDAQVVVERGEDILEVNGPLGGSSGLSVGVADDLPGLAPASSRIVSSGAVLTSTARTDNPCRSMLV